MCGGAGTRLWPLSRKAKPKQFHSLSTQKSMLRETMARAKALGALAEQLDIAAPSFVCALEHEAEIKAQCAAENMPPLRIILEPCPRNTAPVAAIVCQEIAAIDPDGLVLLLPADQHIDRPQAFWASLTKGVEAARNGYLTTFGIAPTRPETGYGYICQGAALDDGAVKVDRFVEKPDLATAKSYVSSGDYFWNGGIFLFSPTAMIEAFEAHAEDILRDSAAALSAAKRKGASIFLDPENFSRCRSESIDYAIMEPAQKRAMVPGLDMGWSDIGSWDVIRDRSLSALGANDAAALGDVIAINCGGSYLRSEGPLIAAIGVKDLIVIATPDAVLITAPDQTQHVKDIVTRLKDEKRTELL